MNIVLNKILLFIAKISIFVWGIYYKIKEKLMSNNKVQVSLKDTREVLTFVIALGKAYEAAKSDGVINVADLLHLLPVIDKIGPAFEGIENVQIELMAMTTEEADELKAWIKTELDLQDEEIEEFIQAAFAVVVDLWMVIRRFFLTPIQPGEVNEGGVSQTETPDTSGSADETK